MGREKGRWRNTKERGKRRENRQYTEEGDRIHCKKWKIQKNLNMTKNDN